MIDCGIRLCLDVDLRWIVFFSRLAFVFCIGYLYTKYTRLQNMAYQSRETLRGMQDSP